MENINGIAILLVCCLALFIVLGFVMELVIDRTEQKELEKYKREFRDSSGKEKR